MDEYKKIKGVLSIAFMTFLDDQRPKNKKCLSNLECEDIDRAFAEQNWSKLRNYAIRYEVIPDGKN